jgi:hypothetical protein
MLLHLISIRLRVVKRIERTDSILDGVSLLCSLLLLNRSCRRRSGHRRNRCVELILQTLHFWLQILLFHWLLKPVQLTQLTWLLLRHLVMFLHLLRRAQQWQVC